MKYCSHFFIACFAILSLAALAETAKIERLQLSNGVVTAEITPDIGGRLLAFSLAGKPNFLLVGEAVNTDPKPDTSPQADNIPYLGHEMWVGPQSQWWVHQQHNAKRAEAKADWPPDPYLILPANKVIEKRKGKIVLQSPESPVTGVQLTKTYELIAKDKNRLRLLVSAKNIRQENIAWDIWFNTRVHADTQVYIPVNESANIRPKSYDLPLAAPLVYIHEAGIFSLDLVPPPAGKKFRNGKMFIQPAQGWMAGFQGEQLFVVKFPLQPVSAIHPEHGQIELYSIYHPGNLAEGLLEMEVHAPYKTLAPGQTMQAEEQWTIMEYKGPNTREAQLAFLRKQSKILNINF
jgi:hypothetical protein